MAKYPFSKCLSLPTAAGKEQSKRCRRGGRGAVCSNGREGSRGATVRQTRERGGGGGQAPNYKGVIKDKGKKSKCNVSGPMLPSSDTHSADGEN